MKRNGIPSGHKILYLLSISCGLVFFSFLLHADFSFASNLAGNATNLTISIPDNSIIMTPTVSVSGTVTDNVQISSITWDIYNGNILAIPGIVPGSSVAWSFDISHLSNGLHTLQINATNSIGFVTSKTISFTLYTDSPVPNASLPNGTYKGSQIVKIQTSDPALIFYTLDGTTPTLSSSHGTDSVTLSEIKNNTVLKYFAVDAYGVRSNVSTQVYIIDGGISPTPIVSNANNVMTSIQKISSDASENKTVSYTTGSPTMLLKSQNINSSKSILTNYQNMTTTVNINDTLSVEVQSNSTTSVPAITQNMTVVKTNSTTPIEVQSNSTKSNVPINAQNMTMVKTNSTMPLINQTNSTLNVSVNGTK